MTQDKSVKNVVLSIAEEIKKKYHPEKIVLFGSFAYGKPSKDSDIDLLIVKDTKERPIDRRVRVRQLVSNLRKGYAFSPIVITSAEMSQRLKIGDQFLKEILSRGEVLYG